MSSKKRKRTCSSDGEDEPLPSAQNRKRAIAVMESRISRLANEVSSIEATLEEIRKRHQELVTAGSVLDAQVRALEVVRGIRRSGQSQPVAASVGQPRLQTTGSPGTAVPRIAGLPRSVGALVKREPPPDNSLAYAVEPCSSSPAAAASLETRPSLPSDFDSMGAAAALPSVSDRPCPPCRRDSDGSEQQPAGNPTADATGLWSTQTVPGLVWGVQEAAGAKAAVCGTAARASTGTAAIQGRWFEGCPVSAPAAAAPAQQAAPSRGGGSSAFPEVEVGSTRRGSRGCEPVTAAAGGWGGLSCSGSCFAQDGAAGQTSQQQEPEHAWAWLNGHTLQQPAAAAAAAASPGADSNACGADCLPLPLAAAAAAAETQLLEARGSTPATAASCAAASTEPYAPCITPASPSDGNAPAFVAALGSEVLPLDGVGGDAATTAAWAAAAAAAATMAAATAAATAAAAAAVDDGTAAGVAEEAITAAAAAAAGGCGGDGGGSAVAVEEDELDGCFPADIDEDILDSAPDPEMLSPQFRPRPVTAAAMAAALQPGGGAMELAAPPAPAPEPWGADNDAHGHLGDTGHCSAAACYGAGGGGGWSGVPYGSGFGPAGASPEAWSEASTPVKAATPNGASSSPNPPALAGPAAAAAAAPSTAAAPSAPTMAPARGRQPLAAPPPQWLPSPSPPPYPYPPYDAVWPHPYPPPLPPSAEERPLEMDFHPPVPHRHMMGWYGYEWLPPPPPSMQPCPPVTGWPYSQPPAVAAAAAPVGFAQPQPQPPLQQSTAA